MSDSEITIPKGFCQCGCGGRTAIAKRTITRKGHIKGEPVRFLIGHATRGRMGESAFNWKGGKPSVEMGYIKIYHPTHPRSHKGRVSEHIVIAETALGKPLPPKAQVHHHSPVELVICENHAYHRLLHQRTRSLKACGHANWRKCWVCKQYDDPVNLKIVDSHTSYHSKCHSDHDRTYRALKKTSFKDLG